MEQTTEVTEKYRPQRDTSKFAKKQIDFSRFTTIFLLLFFILL